MNMREKRISGKFTPEEQKKKLEEEYDRGAWTYDDARFTYAGGIYVDHKEKEAILKNLNKKEEVLEVGCGTARYAPLLEGLGYKYTGIDISQKMLDEGAKKSKTATFINMDAEDLVFPSRSFDNVFYVRVFRVLPNSVKALKEAYRVLKKGGRIIIIYESKDYILQRIHHWFTKTFMGNPCNYFSNEEFTRLLEAVGFKNIKVESVLNVGFYYLIKNKWLMGFVGWLDNHLNTYDRAIIVGEK
jgi:Methylase involved in ubiquinone/menaquinone biosynthesis